MSRRITKNVLKTTEQFVKEAKEKYGDRYNYSRVNYINCDSKITIICPRHGEFFVTPKEHLRFVKAKGNGALSCKNSKG